MTFITGLFLVIPIILVFFIIVYLHSVIIYNIVIFIVDKFTFSKDPFLYKWTYKEKNVLKMSFLFFMLFHLLLFVDFYRTYINDKTKYHDAKVYYVVGMIPHSYSVLLGRFVTPLNPLYSGIIKPANTMKEYLFKKGIEHIPKTDGERELWEYEWFFYPYAIRFSDIYDKYYFGRNEWGDSSSKITRETHNYMYEKIQRLYEIIRAINHKKISDLYREADSIKKMSLMIYYYERKAQFFVHRDLTDEGEWKRDRERKLILEKVDDARNNVFIQWLQALPDRMDTQIQFQEWGNANLTALLKVEATRQKIVLQFMQSVIHTEIKKNKFHCKSETIEAYVKLRNSYMMGGKNSILDALVRNGGEKDALAMHDSSTMYPGSERYRLIIKKYCDINLLGVSRARSDFADKNILDTDNEYITILNKLKKEGKINE